MSILLLFILYSKQVVHRNLGMDAIGPGVALQTI